MLPFGLHAGVISCLYDSIDETRGDADGQIADASRSSRWLPAVNGAFSSKLASSSGLNVLGQVQVYGLCPLAQIEPTATIRIHCIVRLHAVRVPRPQCAPPFPLWSAAGNKVLCLEVMDKCIRTVWQQFASRQFPGCLADKVQEHASHPPLKPCTE